jgi:threonine synthase
MPATWRSVCGACGRLYRPEVARWRCPCGGLLDLAGPLADPFGSTAESPLERYRAALPPFAPEADLGLRITPLAEAGGHRWLKADYAHPTGSFKDRGSSVMVGAAALAGHSRIVVDSSGNAGKAAAAHARAVAVACTVYLPESTPAQKVDAVGAFGAEIVMVPGGRSAAAFAAQAEVDGTGAWYASHAHQPSFHHGVKTLAFELFEQFPGDLGSASVVVPAGNGTLVLGLWIGFGELVALGLMHRRPRLFAVQSQVCAPLAGLPPLAGATSAAAGIAIGEPPRLAQVRAAAIASGGRVVTVTEEAILAARDELAGLGHPVEPTGAVAWAAVPSVDADGPLIAVLTGR